jgi:hypothetical protein
MMRAQLSGPSLGRTAIELHTREHRRRLDELQKKSITRSGTLKLCEELKAWFVNHAIGCEAKVKAFFNRLIISVK